MAGENTKLLIGSFDEAELALLTEEERALELRRLRSQNLDEGDNGIDWNGVKRAFTDWKSYVVTVS